MTDTTQSAESALSPCPFCGGEASVDTSYEVGTYFGCAACGVWRLEATAWNHRAPPTETAIPAWRSGYDTSEEAQAAYFGNMKPGEEGASPKVYNQGGEGLQRPTALSDEGWRLKGIKDGVEHDLGPCSIPPRAKMKELIASYFSGDPEDENEDAAMALWCCEEFKTWYDQRLAAERLRAAPPAEPGAKNG